MKITIAPSIISSILKWLNIRRTFQITLRDGESKCSLYLEHDAHNIAIDVRRATRDAEYIYIYGGAS